MNTSPAYVEKIAIPEIRQRATVNTFKGMAKIVALLIKIQIKPKVTNLKKSF